MRVIVLAHGLLGAGGGSVGKNLIRSLATAGQGHQFLVTIPDQPAFRQIVEDSDRLELLCEPRTNEFGRFRLLRRWLWERNVLSKAVTAARADIILGLSDRGYTNAPCPQAIYLHRPHMFYPEDTWRDFVPCITRLKIRYHCRNLRRVIARENPLLIAQTSAAQKHIVDTFGADRVFVSPNSLSADTVEGTGSEMPAALAKYADKKRFFCLTRYYAHKNLEVLVDLFTQYRQELADSAVFVTLDTNKGNAGPLLEQIRRAGLEKTIVNLGEIPQQELAGYFGHMHGMILPTLLESFSGTYGEAMAFGVPVLTSDRDFARTICDSAAEYFDPLDPGSICKAIRRVIDEPGRSEALIEAGRARLGAISKSWDDIAAELLVELEAFVRERA